MTLYTEIRTIHSIPINGVFFDGYNFFMVTDKYSTNYREVIYLDKDHIDITGFRLETKVVYFNYFAHNNVARDGWYTLDHLRKAQRTYYQTLSWRRLCLEKQEALRQEGLRLSSLPKEE